MKVHEATRREREERSRDGESAQDKLSRSDSPYSRGTPPCGPGENKMPLMDFRPKINI